MRFTIRDLLWLTVVVALSVLWWGEYRQRMTDSAELREDYRRLLQERDRLLNGRYVRFDDEHLQLVKKLFDQSAARRSTSTPRTRPPSPAKN